MGTTIPPSKGWPACGEIDAAENIGSMPDFIQGTLHSGSDETAYYYFPQRWIPPPISTIPQILDWNTSNFVWYVDGHLLLHPD